MTDQTTTMFTGKRTVDGTKFFKGMPLITWAETLAMSVGIAEEPGNFQPKMARADRVRMIMNNVTKELEEVIPDGELRDEFGREFADAFLAALPGAPSGGLA